jgi:hypothetical protein
MVNQKIEEMFLAYSEYYYGTLKYGHFGAHLYNLVNKVSISNSMHFIEGAVFLMRQVIRIYNTIVHY